MAAADRLLHTTLVKKMLPRAVARGGIALSRAALRAPPRSPAALRLLPAATQALALSHRRALSGVSGDSNKAFQPESKVPTADDEVQQWLRKAVKEHKVLLFMKGTPDAPQCGFSRKVALILKDHNASFASANVLNSPEVREGVKVFSNWPTLPQLYIDGEFIGGCDIVTALAESGELKEKLEKAGAVRKLE